MQFMAMNLSDKGKLCSNMEFSNIDHGGKGKIPVKVGKFPIV